jgi:hypothetical protein
MAKILFTSKGKIKLELRNERKKEINRKRIFMRIIILTREKLMILMTTMGQIKIKKLSKFNIKSSMNYL